MCFSCYNTDSLLCFDRDMCQEISTNWGSQTWQDFDQLCEYNPVETELINCLADVREPCQLGCKDLTYCTNFNNRSDSWILTRVELMGVFHGDLLPFSAPVFIHEEYLPTNYILTLSSHSRVN